MMRFFEIALFGTRDGERGKHAVKNATAGAGRRARFQPHIAILIAAALSLSACGFEPLYATNEAASSSGLKSVMLKGVKASDAARPIVERAMERRTMREAEATKAEYDLVIDVREQAQPLAVQIDDAVTRYNYRLLADYVLTPRDGGKAITGKAEAVASFNVVASQYSTLYAEESAREKAARVLAERIEREILLAFAAKDDPEKEAAAAARANQTGGQK
jgi:LPS-assembly lipoprotein